MLPYSLIVKWLHILAVPPAAPWLLVAIILFVLLILAQLALYRPALGELRLLVQRGALDTAAFRRAASRERSIGIAMTAVMLGILFLMVVKPNLWG